MSMEGARGLVQTALWEVSTLNRDRVPLVQDYFLGRDFGTTKSFSTSPVSAFYVHLTGAWWGKISGRIDI